MASVVYDGSLMPAEVPAGVLAWVFSNPNPKPNANFYASLNPNTNSNPRSIFFARELTLSLRVLTLGLFFVRKLTLSLRVLTLGLRVTILSMRVLTLDLIIL